MTVEPGGIISGTVRPEDTVPAMLAVLEEHAPEKAAEIEVLYPRALAALRMGGEPHVTALDMLVESLHDALNEIAPFGYCFGTEEGDGASLGFWPDRED